MKLPEAHSINVKILGYNIPVFLSDLIDMELANIIYFAIDSDGDLYFYNSKPVISSNVDEWYPESGKVDTLFIRNLHPTWEYEDEWKDTLVEVNTTKIREALYKLK